MLLFLSSLFLIFSPLICFFFFFFNDTATTEIYTLSLHDALPIFPDFFFLLRQTLSRLFELAFQELGRALRLRLPCFKVLDRKSTRLNSSHVRISYAVFCLKKKEATSSLNGEIRCAWI